MSSAPPMVGAAPAPSAVVQPTTPAPAALHCENCGATVTQKYCAACGQRVDPPVHSLWHFLEVALEDLTHADSRLWSTLAALLFKPGFLTREFLAGRRARYLPPVRLYLVLSVLFFLVASIHRGGPLQVIQIQEHSSGPPTASIASIEGTKDSPLAARPGESPEQRAQRVCNNAAYQGPWRHFVVTTMHDVCVRSVRDNGQAIREAFLHSLPRAMFVFLPLLAAAMMLMYWRPRHYYVEHLLLFVHNHAFVFLLLVLASLTTLLLPFLSGWVDLAVTLYVAWYAWRSMRVAYGQGRWLTLGKLTGLSFFYIVSGSIMLALTFVYSAITM
jgi:hypothetical protein